MATEDKIEDVIFHLENYSTKKGIKTICLRRNKSFGTGNKRFIDEVGAITTVTKVYLEFGNTKNYFS